MEVEDGTLLIELVEYTAGVEVIPANEIVAMVVDPFLIKTLPEGLELPPDNIHAKLLIGATLEPG